MYLILFCFLLGSIRAQQNLCLCSCCSGLSCNVVPLPTLPITNCTLEGCIVQCRSKYYQCRENHPTTVISAQCQTIMTPQYSCRCDCCNTGVSTCSLSYAGNTLAYTCNVESCSIACSNQYSNLCVANHIGQTLGTCIGLTTTTSALATTTTTMNPSFANTCSCMCCHTGSSCLPMYVGTTTTYRCSSGACTLACQNQYQSSCPVSSNLGQAIGTCLSSTGGNTICKCNCWGTNGFNNYEVITNGDCLVCDSTCRQHSTCTKPDQVTYTCYRNQAKTSLPRLTFIFMMIFSLIVIVK